MREPTVAGQQDARTEALFEVLAMHHFLQGQVSAVGTRAHEMTRVGPAESGCQQVVVACSHDHVVTCCDDAATYICHAGLASSQRCEVARADHVFKVDKMNGSTGEACPAHSAAFRF